MKIFKKSMSLLLAVLLILSLTVTAFAEETTATLGVTASKTDLTVGDEFSVYLNASDDITGIFTFQMDLCYDKEMFEVVSINTQFNSKNNVEQSKIRFGTLDMTSKTVMAKGQGFEDRQLSLPADGMHNRRHGHGDLHGLHDHGRCHRPRHRGRDRRGSPCLHRLRGLRLRGQDRRRGRKCRGQGRRFQQ